jgi:hypothetical protein
MSSERGGERAYAAPPRRRAGAEPAREAKRPPSTAFVAQAGRRLFPARPGRCAQADHPRGIPYLIAVMPLGLGQ